MQKQTPKREALAARVKQNPGAALLLACYAAALLVALLWHFGGFVANRLAYANGTLAYEELSPQEAFALADLEWRDGALVSLGGDPQLLLQDAERRVESLRVDVTYQTPPMTELVYWAAPGEDYALRRMAYPTGDGLFLLPPTGGQSLRFDPGTVAGNVITINRIEINVKRPFWAFFLPSAGEVATLAVLPGLVAAGLYTLWQTLAPARRKGVKAHG